MSRLKPSSTFAIARSATSILLVVIACSAGCGRNPYTGANSYWGAPYASQYPGGVMPGAVVPGGMTGSMMPGAAASQAQVVELERRIQQLDMDNRQLTTQLAQSQQKWQVSDERANLFQRQLQDATVQLQQSRLAQQELQGQARGMQASMSARGGATLRPNTSGPQPTLPGLSGGQMPNGQMPPAQAPGYMPQQIPAPYSGQRPIQSPPMGPSYSPGIGSSTNGSALNGSTVTGSLASSSGAYQVPGASVAVEGSVVRIRVPADQLFAPGSGTLNPNAYLVLDNVANAVHRNFQRQRIAIEAHTDTGNLTGGAFSTPYQLSTAQAQAVMDQLVRRNQVPTQQLAVVAHGPNIPRADNQTPAGRAENRRIEFVVYPDRF